MSHPLVKGGFLLEQKPNQRFVVMRQSIILDKNLTPTEKLVYARVCSFDEFFESSETTAELFGVKSGTVKKAKIKLERLGYIKCVRNTGRGKAYVAIYDDQPEPSKLEASANQTCTDMDDRRARLCTSDVHIYAPIEKNREENIELDTNVSRAKQPDEYGNSDINAIFQAWQDAGLPAITSRMQANRRAVWNMLRNKQIGRERLFRGVQLAGKAYGEPYAPAVLSFEDLNRKLTALELWNDKKASASVHKSSPATRRDYSPTYSGEIAHERRPYDERPAVLDYERSAEIVSDEFLEQCRKKFNK